MLSTDEITPVVDRDYATTQRELGFALLAALSYLLWQPLPDAIRELLEQLAAKERQNRQ